MDKKIRQTIFQTMFSIIFILALVFGLSLIFRNELMKYSTLFMGTIGIFGFAICILVSDIIPGFVPIDMFLVMAIAAGFNDIQVILSSSVASILGGTIAYMLGKYVFHAIPVIKSILVTYEYKMDQWVKVYGKNAVVIAALTPIPYSWMAYTAGRFKMRYLDFFNASLFRFVRFAVYFYAIKIGWISG